MSRLPLWVSAGLLAAVGLALMIYKVVALGYPVLPAARIACLDGASAIYCR